MMLGRMKAKVTFKSSQTVASITSIVSNGEVYSGNGVCNNLDECSCNVEYILGLTVAGIKAGIKADISSRRNNGANPGVIAGSVVVVLVVLVALVVAIVIVTLFIIMRTKKNRTFSPSRSKPRTYVSRTTSDGRTKPGIHGSTDDLLMTGVSPSGSSPIPPPSGGPITSYKPYAPPTYTASPMVSVSQDVRRSPPNKPKPRPPPPSRTPPAVRVVDKPSPAVTRPPPPTKKPLSVNKLNQSTKPSTAPKPPNKVAGKWPPPLAQESNTTKPSVPMKPPIIPRKQ